MQEEAPSAPAHTITSEMRYPQYCLHCGLVSRGRAACCSTVGVSEAVGKRGGVSAGDGDENGNWDGDGDWDVGRYAEEDDHGGWDGRGNEERNGSGLGTGDVDEEGDRDENGDEDRDGTGSE